MSMEKDHTQQREKKEAIRGQRLYRRENKTSSIEPEI